MIKSTHYRTPRTVGECKWNPHMAPIEKSFRPHRNQRLDRWIMVLALLVMLGGLMLLSGCGEREHLATPTESTFDYLFKTTPDEHGVVCYQSGKFAPQPLSCVKVR